MELILIILASIVLLFQFSLDFLLDFLAESKKLEKKNIKKTKITIGIIILIIGLIAIWITFIVQKNDKTSEQNRHTKENRSQQTRFDNIDSINTILKTELRLRNNDLIIIKNQNDSLKFLLFNVSKKQEKFLVISEASVKEVSKSRTALENMGFKQISRGISEYDKIEMINIIKSYKKGKVSLTTLLGDPEAFQFAEEIKEVFEASGWKVDGISQAVYTKPMIGVVINVKSEKYPIRVNEIFNAFKVLNIIAIGNINQNLQDDSVELIIGSKL